MKGLVKGPCYDDYQACSRLVAAAAKRRSGFSTLELLVSVSIASVLTLGLSGAVLIAGKSLQLPQQATENKALIGADFGRLRDSLNDTLAFTVDSKQKFRLLVPDRNGDSLADELTYTIEKDCLIERLNGDHPRIVSRDVRSLSFGTLPLEAPELPHNRVRFQASSQASVFNGQQLEITYPDGCILDDFLLLVVATDQVVEAPTLTPVSWIPITSHAGTNYTLAVWCKRLSPGDASTTVLWNTNCNAVAAILRLENVSLQNPIGFHSSVAGQADPGQQPALAPSVLLSSAGGLVVQMLATHQDALVNRSGGLQSHMTCAYAEAGNVAVVCSVHQGGEQTGVFDANNAYQFARSDHYVAVGIGVVAQ